MIKTLLVFLFLGLIPSLVAQNVVDKYGAITRSDTTSKSIYLCFTGHDFYDGFRHVLAVLKDHEISASFFLTGDFVRKHEDLVAQMISAGHYVGAHSDKHLLYCDWSQRDSLLHSEHEIKADIRRNLGALSKFGIRPRHFMPPYEWYNKKVVDIARALNQVTVNFTPGTRSNADYTTPDMPNYISSNAIFESVLAYEKSRGMNGFHLLIHPGTDPKRKDKFYLLLDNLLIKLRSKDYQFWRF